MCAQNGSILVSYFDQYTFVDTVARLLLWEGSGGTDWGVSYLLIKGSVSKFLLGLLRTSDGAIYHT
jgi:hypothetical protein